MDLLEHEVVESALLGLLGVPIDMDRCPIDRRTTDRLDDGAVFCDRHQLIVFDDEEIAGAVEQGRNVRGEIGLTISEADHERADLANRHDLARFPHRHDDECIGAFGALYRAPHGRGEVVLIFLRDQVGQDFGVGLRCEDRPAGLQLLAQGLEVLDDPVVHNHELAGGIDVGMRIEITRFTVRCPTGVPDSHRTGQRLVLETSLEIDDLPLGFPHIDRPVGYRNTGRVVAPILEASQPIHDDGSRFARADIAHDSAHARYLLEVVDRRALRDDVPAHVG